MLYTVIATSRFKNTQGWAYIKQHPTIIVDGDMSGCMHSDQAAELIRQQFLSNPPMGCEILNVDVQASQYQPYQPYPEKAVKP